MLLQFTAHIELITIFSRFHRYAYSFGAISAGVVFIWGIPALFYYLMWHARNVNVAKQWYVLMR